MHVEFPLRRTRKTNRKWKTTEKCTSHLICILIINYYFHFLFKFNLHLDYII